MYGRDEKLIQNFGENIWRKETTMEDPGIEIGWEGVRLWTAISGLSSDTSNKLLLFHNEHTFSLKGGEFLG
jgi:hypothetical protein